MFFGKILSRGTRCVPSRFKNRDLPCFSCGRQFQELSTENLELSNELDCEVAFEDAPYKVDVGGSSPSSPTFFINKTRVFCDGCKNSFSSVLTTVPAF
jgi:hypothetical protein